MSVEALPGIVGSRPPSTPSLGPATPNISLSQDRLRVARTSIVGQSTVPRLLSPAEDLAYQVLNGRAWLSIGTSRGPSTDHICGWLVTRRLCSSRSRYRGRRVYILWALSHSSCYHKILLGCEWRASSSSYPPATAADDRERKCQQQC